MQMIACPPTAKNLPAMAEFSGARAASYWYWFSHGVPQADAYRRATRHTTRLPAASTEAPVGNPAGAFGVFGLSLSLFHQGAAS